MLAGTFCCYLLLAIAFTTGVQTENAFVNPDPWAADGNQTFYNGEPIEISWRPLTDISQQKLYTVSENIIDPSGFASLWMRSWNPTAKIYLIALNLNINTTEQSELRTTWICNVTNAEILGTDLWFFEMKPNVASSSAPYNETRDEWPSVKFKIHTATALAKPTTPATSSTHPPAVKLSTGAKAGIGTGAAIAAIIIALLLVHLFKRHSNRQQVLGDNNQSLSEQSHIDLNTLDRPYELSSEKAQPDMPQELHSYIQIPELAADHVSKPPQQLRLEINPT